MHLAIGLGTVPVLGAGVEGRDLWYTQASRPKRQGARFDEVRLTILMDITYWFPREKKKNAHLSFLITHI